MDYERIQKPCSSSSTSGGSGGCSGGALSPAKLRLMLLGLEERKKAEEDLGSTYHLYRSESEPSSTAEIDEMHSSASGSSKDVDAMSSATECATSPEMAPGSAIRRKDYAFTNSKSLRAAERDSLGSDGPGVSVFEFQRAERASHRPAVVPPFSKPTPSKWDDAQKWIASPTSNRQGKGGAQAKRVGFLGYESKHTATKVVTEVVEEPDTKRIDSGQWKKEFGCGQKSGNWVVPDTCPVVDTLAKPAVLVRHSVDISAINFSRHDSSSIVQTTAFITPPSTVRSVSMRDMGTEMTPIVSQEPSRTGTPARATTPIRSATSSQHSSPRGALPRTALVDHINRYGDPNKKELTEKELQMKTRREIMLLGTKLGKLNIAAWACTEQEDKDASLPFERASMVTLEKSVIEIRAAAWEQAERAKYLARFKREEMKIQAWENHQKAKAEAEMRKTEVEIERLRAHSHDRLTTKLEAVKHEAEEKRAAAEAKHNQQAAKAAQQAEYIHRTGRIPCFFSCWSCCF